MSWLFPGFLAAAAAVALPLILHVLRRWPRRPVVFPSHMFLSAGVRRTESWWQRFNRWLVLLLRCAIIAALAAVFARPFLRSDKAHEGRAVILVIDNSFSLQAKGRWDQARDWARERIGTLASGDTLGVLLVAPEPNWAVPPTNETARPLAVLRGLSPGWQTSRVEPALRLAADTLAASPAPRREIIVLGDHQQLSWSGADFTRKLPRGITVTFQEPATAVASQAAIAVLAIRRSDEDLVATVRIRHFAGPLNRTIRVHRNGAAAPVREQTVELAEGQSRTMELHVPGAGDAEAYFRFSLDPDDLPADDTAYAAWRPVRNASVLLDPPPPNGSADFVATALKALNGSADVPLRVESLPASVWSPHATLVLRNDESFSSSSAGRLDAFFAGGGTALMFMTSGPSQERWLVAHQLPVSALPATGERRNVSGWAMEHPLVAELSRRRLEVLLGWTFTRGWSLAGEDVATLARWSDGGAAMIEARVGAGRIVLCGFAPDRGSGDWPVTASFVPYVHQAAAYLRQIETTAYADGTTGEPVRLGALAGEWRALDGPAVGEGAKQVSGMVVPALPGIYGFTGGTERLLCAVNVPAQESDLTPWLAGTPWKDLAAEPAPEREKSGPAPAADLVSVEAEQKAPLWWWAAVIGACLWMVELGLANRTAR